MQKENGAEIHPDRLYTDGSAFMENPKTSKEGFRWWSGEYIDSTWVSHLFDKVGEDST